MKKRSLSLLGVVGVVALAASAWWSSANREEKYEPATAQEIAVAAQVSQCVRRDLTNLTENNILIRKHTIDESIARCALLTRQVEALYMTDGEKK